MFTKTILEEIMNIQTLDILNLLFSTPYTTQRTLAKLSGLSVGAVNHSIKELSKNGFIDESCVPTTSPKSAVILAAGFGMRMVPINTETPKGLLEVHGETLIERLIKQLHEVGITDIYVVVGFLKEQYEYLIDLYNVQLIVNPDYAIKNNLHSLKLVSKYLSNTYIIPCDLWCKTNPFNKYELYPWYMVSDVSDKESSVRVTRKRELFLIDKTTEGNTMLGICYLTKDLSEIVKKRLDKFCNDHKYDNIFWEETICEKNKMLTAAKIVPSDNILEINTYEQLRELDSNSNQLKSEAIEIAANALNVNTKDITNISVLKKGMTNRSFLFECCDQKYIMRIPGECTDNLINRSEEAQVYQAIQHKGLCDDIIYINPDNGYKITKFFNNARVCSPENKEDVKKCMKKLRILHEMELKVDHRFNLFEQIDFYEQLWNGHPSAYRDYKITKEKVLSLKPYISSHIEKEVLTHIDAVPDNFLFIEEASGSTSIRLIDWEYAGMQDPHIDIAMFCIYSFYEKQRIDETIDFYFNYKCPENIRIKIYCYIAVCGLLWSNWCEYKRNLGIDFGEYSLRQYRYAKEFYKIVQDKLQ